MELSNLRPAEGSTHSDNFRRGRGHGSGTVSYTHLDVYKRQAQEFPRSRSKELLTE